MTGRPGGTRARKIANTAARDQVAAALRDAEQAMTTSEFGELVTGSLYRPCDDENPCVESPEHRVPQHWSHPMHVSPGVDVVAIEVSSYTAGNQLAALQRAGLVEREKVGIRVYWTWVGEPVEVPPLVITRQH